MVRDPEATIEEFMEPREVCVTGKKSLGFFVCFNCFVCLQPFQVYNAKDLAEEMAKIQSVLSDDKNDWEHRVAAVRETFCFGMARL